MSPRFWVPRTKERARREEDWCRREESNLRPSGYDAAALPVELRRHEHGAAGGARTPDLRCVKPALYQLSYRSERWSSRRESKREASVLPAGGARSGAAGGIRNAKRRYFPPAHEVEQPAGIEPAMGGWKPPALPLGDGCVELVRGGGFEPPSFCVSDSCSDRTELSPRDVDVLQAEGPRLRLRSRALDAMRAAALLPRGLRRDHADDHDAAGAGPGHDV